MMDHGLHHYSTYNSKYINMRTFETYPSHPMTTEHTVYMYIHDADCVPSPQCLASIKVFNLCLTLEATDIVGDLFKMLFGIIK